MNSSLPRGRTRDDLSPGSRAGWGFPSDFSLPAVVELFERIPPFGIQETPDEWLETLAAIPMLHQPGKAWLYNTCSDVQGVLVARIAGQPLPEVLAERIFEPLGMTDTGFFVPHQKQARFAANYYSDGKGRLIIRDDPAKSGYLHKPGLASGGGGLVGTASDYLRFLLMIADGGEWQGKRILSAESAERMHTNQLPKDVDWIGFGDEKRTGVGFGLGFSVTVEPSDKNPHARKNEYGWGGAASTHYWVSPPDQLIVVTMEQRWPYSPETEEALKPVIYDAIVK
jgi:CubicO group peptidase (beta-lactamase class C family)